MFSLLELELKRKVDFFFFISGGGLQPPRVCPLQGN